MFPMTIILVDWYLNSKGGRGKLQHKKHRNLWRSLWRTKVKIRWMKKKVANKRKHMIPYNPIFHQERQ
jgi:hypothetical protein